MRRPLGVTIIQAVVARLGCTREATRRGLASLTRREPTAGQTSGRVNPYLGSLGLAVGAVALAIPINLITQVSSLTRVCLLAVLVSAITYGLWPALFASLISIVLYDFFFLSPVYSLSIASTQDMVNVCLFFLTAVAVSVLAARVRRHAVAADRRALTAEKLSVFTRALAGVLTVKELAETATRQSAGLLNAVAVLLLPDDDGLVPAAVHPPLEGPAPTAWQAATGAWPAFLRHQGANDRIVASGWHFQVLGASGDPVGMIGIQVGALGDGLTAERAQLLDALAQQTGLAIERIALRQRLEDLRVKAETEQLRAALLTSISHDLRTPLASIIGSASSLDHRWTVLSDDSKLMLVATVREEAERLNRFIANLLDITRVEAGTVEPRNEAVQLQDVLGSALHQARVILGHHRIEASLPADLPLVCVDAVLLGQAVFNVLDNAAKYAPAGSLIRIVAEADAATVRLSVLDEGQGIPDAELDRVFDRYYRVDAARRAHAGTGLGLAICRGFLAAMNGSIAAGNRTDRRGAMFTLTLPAVPHFELSEADFP